MAFKQSNRCHHYTSIVSAPDKCGKTTSCATRFNLFRITWLKLLAFFSQKGDTTSTLKSRRVQQDNYQPKINEVLFLPDATSSDPDKQRKFVEIFTRSTLRDCVLENDDGSFRTTFDVTQSWSVFTVMEDTELNTEQQVSQSGDKLWVRSMDLKEIDSIGLFCDDKLVDFVAWGKDGKGPNGALHSTAASAGIWNSGEFVETGLLDLGNGLFLGLQSGDSIGRDTDWSDTNSPKDWTTHGGWNSKGPTPSKRNYGLDLPVINEVLIQPYPQSKNIRKRRSFVEIFRPDRFVSLSGCSLVTANGSLRVDFDSSFDSSKKLYVAVKHKDTLNADFKLRPREGILWMRDFKLNDVDAVALICQSSLVDYVAWGKDGVGPNGPLHDRAKAAYMWNTTIADFVETGPLDLGIGLTSRGMRKGESLGRDGGSNDTDSPIDWSYPAGLDARVATPSLQNLKSFTTPLINEVLFLPDPESSNLKKRRAFIEIYRQDTSQSLKRCSLVNDGGTFRVDFDEALFDIEYLIVKHKDTLDEESKLQRSKGILWVRNFSLNDNDGVALVCKGTIIDYVAWGKDDKRTIGPLHRAAVATRAWNVTNDIINTDRQSLEGGYVYPALRKGDSLGRDEFSTDTNGPRDWSHSCGLNANSPTPSARNLDGHSDLPVINEVMANPNKDFQFALIGRYFVELYRPDPTLSLDNCSLVSDDGSTLVNFDASKQVDRPYFTVIQDENLGRKFKLQKSEGILWARDFTLENGVGLVCNDIVIDYVAWANPQGGPVSALRKAAVSSGSWGGIGFKVETDREDLGGGYSTLSMWEGESIGRDKDSTNTHVPSDFAYPGGIHANVITPTARNEEYSDLPLINEVLFNTDPESPFLDEREMFIEVFRRDVSYPIDLCKVHNHDGSFRDGGFYNWPNTSTNHTYLTNVIGKKPEESAADDRAITWYVLATKLEASCYSLDVSPYILVSRLLQV